MSSINFDNPWLLFIFLPVFALFAAPFFIAIRKDNLNGHNIASAIMHVVMALIIAFVAAGTSITVTSAQTDVYVLADVSYSATRNLDTVDDYISDLRGNLPPRSRMGVICFGRDYKLISRLGEGFKTVKDSGVDDSGTDITGVLNYAGSLFRNDVIKRIVLVTDGKQTVGGDASSVKRQVDALAERNIHVDAIYLDDNLKEDAREVQISDVSFSPSVCLNREEDAVLSVECSLPAESEVGATVTLYKDGEEYDKLTQQITRGVNNFTFALDTTTAGTFSYEAVVSCSEDENHYNDKITFTQTVSGRLSVLFISDSEEDYRAFSDLYGESADIDAYVTVTDGYKVPCTVEEMSAYDQIVLSNVDATRLENTDMFLSSLDTSVSLFGKSLLTFGDVYVQNYAGGELRGLSNLLPVAYGKSDDAAKLYTLVIDTSRSMEFNEKLKRAKEAAKEIVGLLSESDMVAIVEFNGDAFTPYSPAPIANNREAILNTIDSLTVRQGTNIGSGLQAAFDLMKNGRYSEKRVMLISDGLNFTEDGKSAADIAEEMRDYDIFCSSLDVGRGADQGAIATQAKNLLQRVSEVGGGSYLDISTSEDLQRVVMEELPSDMNSFEGGYSYIGVKRRKDDVMQGIADGSFANSYVRNYVYGFAKSNAKTVLTVDYTKKSGNTVTAPLYAYWNYGNGKAASFTSALSGEWVDSVNAELRQKLFSNVLETNTPNEKINAPFLMDIVSSDGLATVSLTPASLHADASATLEITSPDGEKTGGAMAFGASSFNYTFVTPAEGGYKVAVTYEYGGRTFALERTLNVSYSAEYNSFTLYDAAVLHKIVGTNGKVSEDGKLSLENSEAESKPYSYSLTLPLLIACVVLYAVDIAVRKLKWEDILSFFKRVKK